jgi:ActR/RegA family two-component response regulator
MKKIEEEILRYLQDSCPCTLSDIASAFSMGSWDMFEILSAFEEKGLASVDMLGQWVATGELRPWPESYPERRRQEGIGGYAGTGQWMGDTFMPYSFEDMKALIDESQGNVRWMCNRLGIFDDVLNQYLETMGLSDYWKRVHDKYSRFKTVGGYNKKQVKELLKKHQGNLSEVAREIGVSIRHMQAVAKEWNLRSIDYRPGPRLAGPRAGGPPSRLDPDEVMQLLEESLGNVQRAADILGVQRSTLAKWLKRRNIKVEKKPGIGGFSIDRIMEILEEEDGNKSALARRIGANVSWVRRFINKHNIIIERGPDGVQVYQIKENPFASDWAWL